MYDAKIIKLLTEMKMNCLNGTAYDDPLRGDKAEALNYAIFAVNAVSGGYRWHDLRKDPNDLPRDMDNVQICWVGGSHYWYDSMFWDAYRGVFSVYGKTEYEVIHPIIGDKRYSTYGKAIAWRKIEPFEVSECG